MNFYNWCYDYPSEDPDSGECVQLDKYPEEEEVEEEEEEEDDEEGEEEEKEEKEEEEKKEEGTNEEVKLPVINDAEDNSS